MILRADAVVGKGSAGKGRRAKPRIIDLVALAEIG
jgi:hypothetical protein